MSRAQLSKAENSAELKLNGHDFRPDVSGALYWPQENTIIVSDLHFEKGSFFATRNLHLPPYDTGHTLDVLERVVAQYQPQRLIALGDSFHDAQASERLSLKDRSRIKILTASCDWIWIAGNHDPAPPHELGGTGIDELNIKGITFRHEPSKQLAAAEIAGHLHPVAVISTRARRLRRRAFITNGQRLIMPALGAYTGGMNARSDQFKAYFGDHHFHAWALGEDQVFQISSRKLRI